MTNDPLILPSLYTNMPKRVNNDLAVSMSRRPRLLFHYAILHLDMNQSKEGAGSKLIFVTPWFIKGWGSDTRLRSAWRNPSQVISAILLLFASHHTAPPRQGPLPQFGLLRCAVCCWFYCRGCLPRAGGGERALPDTCIPRIVYP